jgi:hypothetical protein
MVHPVALGALCAPDALVFQLPRFSGRQVNKEGTLHSTPFGNEQQAKGAFAALRGGLYPDGRVRPLGSGG